MLNIYEVPVVGIGTGESTAAKIINQSIRSDIVSFNLKFKDIDEIRELNDENYTINDLFKFMNENFEYGGILSLNNERIKLPFGPVNGVAKNNILIGYNDEYVFRSIIDMYIKIGNISQLEGINLYSNKNFNTNYSDGLIVEEVGEGFELSIQPW